MNQSNLSPLKQAFLAIEELQAKLEAAEKSRDLGKTPIAVIGLGCRFPGGANDPQTFWENLRNGVDAIRDVPADRWDAEAIYDPDPDAPGKSYVRKAGFIDQIDGFDPQFFSIAPREAHSMDPQQRLLLEVAWEALEHAGIDPHSLHGSSTGIFVGIASSDYASLSIKANDPTLLDTYFGSGVAHSIASGRISYILGLHGPSISVDTACSSSLVSSHLAVQSLRIGDCDLALACGVNLILLPDNQIAFSRLHMMAGDGRCKTFDADADGFGDGEGCGVVVLKRLPDALRDGDRILAVIRGSAINQDGASSGLTAPNGQAQEAVIRAALANADLQPAEIGYVETHGTGTSLGDPIEVRALGNVLREGRPAGLPFYLGSVKTNVGHLESGAGITGLIKAILMVQHGEIPPNLNFSTPNPHIEWDEIPAVVPTQIVPWPAQYARRLSGVSAFGFSGTNAHMIVEEPPKLGAPVEQVEQVEERSERLLTLSARTEPALRELAESYIGTLADPHTAARFPDFAFTANTGRAKFNARLAVVAADAAQASQKLSAFLEGEDTPGVFHHVLPGGDPPKIAFLFTGQGAQYAGMGKALYHTQPIFRAAMDRCDELLRPLLGESILETLFSEPSDALTARINHTAFTQPAMFAIEYSLAQLWQHWGIHPSAVMGHSLGEYVAGVVAGVFSLEDGIRLIAARGRLMGSLPEGGGMAVAFTSPEKVNQAIDRRSGTAPVCISGYNSPDATVLSGDLTAVQEVVDSLGAEGVRTVKLSVSHAFHSPLMDPMLDEFERIAGEVSYSAPKIRFISDVSGDLARGTQVANARYWREHAREPVQFVKSIETLYREGMDIFLEIGPNPTLTGLGQRILADPARPIHWVNTLKGKQDDWTYLLSNLGALFTFGVRIDWAAFETPSTRQRLTLPTYPFQRSRFWLNLESAAQTSSLAPHVRDRDLSQAVHPLLGLRLRSPAKTISYENWLSSADFSFLDDHRLFGSAVLPGTSYIEMGLAAGREFFPGDAFSIEDLTIQRPISIADGQERLMQVLLTPEDAQSIKMDVYTQEAEESPWLLHASGLIVRSAAEIKPPGVDLAEIQARCTQIISAEDHYQRLSQAGLEFGDSLRGVSQLWRREGEALGQIRRSAAAATESGYILHPALLDAHLQVMSAALPNQKAAYLPFNFAEIRQFGPGEPVWCHVQIQDPGGSETLHADLSLLDQSGQVVLQIDGVTLKRADRSSIQPDHPDDYRNWLYQVSWQPAPAEKAQAPSVISPVALAEELEPTLNRLYEENGLDEYVSGLLPEFDRLTRIYITNAFLKMGWQPRPGQRFTTPELAGALKVNPQHHRLIGQLLRILSEDGVVSEAAETGGAWEVRQAPQPEDATALHARLTSLFPQYSGELEVTGRCGEQFAEALQGKADPLQLLFPGGSLATVEKIYQKSPAALTYNGLVRAVVESILTTPSAAKDQAVSELRVLEIGAGTGGTSSFVLPLLPAESSQYTFTDISPMFTEKAKHKFSQYPFIRYQPLDIENDPDGQGLAGEQFDLIIAANVIHATRDLQITLRHVRKLLAPNGIFIMLEVTAPQRWVDITFGMTDGWWRFTDKELRPTYPLLSRLQWTDLLRSVGFPEAAAIPQVSAAAGPIRIEEAVIVARAPGVESAVSQQDPAGWLIFGDSATTGSQLAELLRGKGHTCHLGDLDLADLNGYFTANKAVQEVVFLSQPAADSVLEGIEEHGDLHHLLVLVQAIAQSGITLPRLWIVTQGGQSTPSQPKTDPRQAALWGFGKTLELEYPDLPCVQIDLDPRDLDPASSLFHELSASDLTRPRESQVALRGEDRLAARLTRLKDLPGMGMDASPEQSSEAPRALTLTQPGDLNSLTWQSAERRSPGPGEVEILVQASGLNFKDLMTALGMVPPNPLGLGAECAGLVSALGEGVSHLNVNDPVIALAGGSFNTRVITPAILAAPAPVRLSVEQAATVLVPFITATIGLEHFGQMKSGDRVLIHAGAGGVGLAAIQLARRCGAEIFATAGSPEKRAYLETLGVEHVLDSRSLAFAEEIMRLTQGRGVDLVLNSLAGEFIPRSLSVVATGGHFVELGKSGLLTQDQVQAKYPGIHYFIVDWTEQIHSDPQMIAGLIHDITAGLDAGDLQPLPVRSFAPEQAVAAFRFMQQARHTGKIVIRHPNPESGPIVRPDASYLVVGGLRGLGWLTANWLVAQGARSLALMGRSEPSSEVLSGIAELEKAGISVCVIQGDVSREEDVLRALDAIRGSSHPVLRGVIHSAGRLHDAALQNQTWPSFQTVLGPKVTGAFHLHRLTSGLPLDFFVMYSSIASILGTRGQANHSAANAYMDALAHARRSQGLPGLSINWGVWAEVGAAADLGTVERSAQHGIESFSPEDGLEVLGVLMRSTAAQAMVSRMNWPVFLEGFEAAPPEFLSEMVQEAARSVKKSTVRRPDGKSSDAKPAAPPQPEILRQLAETPIDRRSSLLLEFVQKQASKVLGVEASALSEFTPLNELGLDSLMAVELRNLLGKNLGLARPLPVTLAFDYPTTTAISNYLAKEVLSLDEKSTAPVMPEPAPVLLETQAEATASTNAAVLDSIEEMSDDDVERLMSEMTKGIK